MKPRFILTLGGCCVLIGSLLALWGTENTDTLPPLGSDSVRQQRYGETADSNKHVNRKEQVAAREQRQELPGTVERLLTARLVGLLGDPETRRALRIELQTRSDTGRYRDVQFRLDRPQMRVLRARVLCRSTDRQLRIDICYNAQVIGHKTVRLPAGVTLVDAGDIELTAPRSLSVTLSVDGEVMRGRKVAFLRLENERVVGSVEKVTDGAGQCALHGVYDLGEWAVRPLSQPSTASRTARRATRADRTGLGRQPVRTRQELQRRARRQRSR